MSHKNIYDLEIDNQNLALKLAENQKYIQAQKNLISQKNLEKQATEDENMKLNELIEIKSAEMKELQKNIDDKQFLIHEEESNQQKLQLIVQTIQRAMENLSIDINNIKEEIKNLKDKAELSKEQKNRLQVLEEELKSKMAQFEQEIAKIKNEISKLTNTLNNTKRVKRRNVISAKIDKLHDQLAKVQSSYAQIKTKIGVNNLSMLQKISQIQKFNNELKDEKKQMGWKQGNLNDKKNEETEKKKNQIDTRKIIKNYVFEITNTETKLENRRAEMIQYQKNLTSNKEFLRAHYASMKDENQKLNVFERTSQKIYGEVQSNEQEIKKKQQIIKRLDNEKFVIKKNAN